MAKLIETQFSKKMLIQYYECRTLTFAPGVFACKITVLPELNMHMTCILFGCLLAKWQKKAKHKSTSPGIFAPKVRSPDAQVTKGQNRSTPPNPKTGVLHQDRVKTSSASSVCGPCKLTKEVSFFQKNKYHLQIRKMYHL